MAKDMPLNLNRCPLTGCKSPVGQNKSAKLVCNYTKPDTDYAQRKGISKEERCEWSDQCDTDGGSDCGESNIPCAAQTTHINNL